MNLKDIKEINETYHKGDRPQKRIITSNNFTYKDLVEVLDEHIKGKNSILDLGCGVGTLDCYLARRGHVITGVDQSEIAISFARRNATLLGVFKNVKYFQKNIFKFESKEKFDDVILFEVLEHLPDDIKVIKKANSLLKKNGILFISTRSINAPLVKMDSTKKHDKRVGHFRRYTMEQLEAMVVNSGFRIVYKTKKEGVLKEFLFVYPKIGSHFVRVANKFVFISKILSFIDTVLLKLFGEAQLIIVAKKI